MPRKRVTFIVIPPNDGQVHEFRFSTKLLASIGIFCLALFGVLSYYSLGYYGYTEEQETIAELREQNAALMAGVTAQRKKIDGMELAMQQVVERDQKLRNWHDMPILTDDERIGGMGGSDDDLPADYTDVVDSKLRLLSDLSSRINRLELEAKAHERSFKDIREKYLKSDAELSLLPTIMPVNSKWTWISSGFGRRDDPFTGRPARHNGVDFAGRKGTDIFATADGVVVYSHDGGPNNRLGNIIVIQHETEVVEDETGEEYTIVGKYRTEYGHLDKRLVKKGDRVERGQLIATMGSTGRSTGPHLHYAVREKGRMFSSDKGYVDPMDFLFDRDNDALVSGWQSRPAE